MALALSSSGYLSRAVALVPANNAVTFACWAKNAATNVNECMASIGRLSTNNVRWQLDVNNGTVRMISVNTAGSAGVGSSSGTYSADTWFHAAGVVASTTSRTAYLNGVAGTTDTTNISVSAVDGTRFGAIAKLNTFIPWNGDLAEMAIWDVALTAAEIASLAAGVSPLLIRPGNLVSYVPGTNGTTAIDVVGGTTYTNNGTVAASAHPRVFLPSAQILRFPSGASSGTTVAVPKASLVLTGYAPTVTASNHITVSVPKGSLVLSGYAPTVTVSSGTTIFVPKASLTLTGYAPNVLVPQVVQVPKGGLVLTGYAPDVLTPVTVLVPKGTLTITGYAPTIVVTSNKLIEIPKGTLVLRGYAPTVLGTVVAATNKGSYSEPDRRLRERLRRLAIQQAYIEDDEEALAILLATIMREYR